jgi:anti-sigma factor RsiW
MTNLDHVSTETLADYAEGLLRESEAAAVDAHLDGCAECRAEEELLKSLSLILAADSPGPMPAVYAARIDAALAEVAMTDPLSGSFHPEGSAFQGAALDLTPSAFASASAAGGDGPSADVIDLSARRRLVAQGLSRVTTVAASIVLLIGGTVLGLQAINSGNTPGTGDNNPAVADQAGKPVRPTTQPSVRTRVTAVPIDPNAKKNSDGSFTNPDGTVIRKDGSAVTPKGDVIKAPKPAVIGDPAATNQPDSNPGTAPVRKNQGGVAAAQAPSGPYLPGTEPTTPADSSKAAPGPAAAATQDAAAAEPSKASAKAADPGATPAATTDGGAKAMTAPVDTPPPAAASSSPYFDQSGDTYDTSNFAKKVLALLKKSNYQASSTGDAVPDQAPAAVNPDPAVSPSSSNAFTPSSIAIAMANPAAADAAAAPDAADSARPAFKQRAMRCASAYSGDLLAADGGIWEGKAATIVVMTDPSDPNQVIGRVFSGNCKDKAATEAGLMYTQFVVTKTS